ncbi:MAG: hypothetical protein QOE28_2396 [Solirubrobacteraceae bacterium]|nr:hypothetical protein [Solirubrobacteraceae bacterium]
MRRRAAIAGLAASIALAALAPTSASARPACGDGVRLFLEGPVRIFGVPFRTASEEGYDEYACLGAHGRTTGVGLVDQTTGTGSAGTPAFAIGGHRYLGVFAVSDGEGGPDASYWVTDLRTGRDVLFTNAAFESGVVPPFRVAADGSLVRGGEAVSVMRPGVRGAKTLSNPSATAGDLAMTGATVYWTERPGGVRSAKLPGLSAGPEALMLEPTGAAAAGATCGAAHGRTIAASPHVRVFTVRPIYSTGLARRACRIRGGPAIGLPAGSAPVPRIVGDRWLLALTSGRATVYDMRTGAPVARAAGVDRATVLADGSLAWIDASRGVFARAPGAAAATQLAPATPAPGALAAGRHVVYWTAGGEPHGARRPG